jgi:DNA polymerase type B, organellar and viral
MTRTWCAIDAEGDAGGRGLLGVAFYSVDHQEYVTDHTMIVAHLLDHARAGETFIAHNASYELGVVFWQLNIPMAVTYFDDRFSYGSWKYSSRQPAAELWDSAAMTGTRKLEDLGHGIGLQKYPTPQKLLGKDPDKYEWRCEQHGTWECVSCYAIRDAEIVYRAVVGLERLLGGWDVGPARSIAGMALSLWRAVDRPLPCRITGAKEAKLARDGYLGGRCEVLKLGIISPLYTADMSSMYGAVMAETPYPDPERLTYLTNVPWSQKLAGQEGMAECVLSVPAASVLPLPYTHKGERSYPAGQLTGVWTLRELRYAVSLGAVVHHVVRVASTSHVLQPFALYVPTLWELRQAYERKGHAYALFAKLLLNNLYGRIGMRDCVPRRTIAPMLGKWTPAKTHGRNHWVEGDQRWIETTTEQRTHSEFVNAMWAAQTTSEARIRLHQHMVRQGTELVYADTDSIFSSSPIVGLGEGLGALRDTGTYRQAVIAGPKLYALEDGDGTWHARARGVPAAHALEFLRRQQVTFSKPLSPLEAKRQGRAAGEWVEITKHHIARPLVRTPIYPERLTLDAGWSDTLPPHVG